jgi:hypothetical protein
MSDLKDIKKYANNDQLMRAQDAEEDEDEEYYKKGHQIVLHEDK